MTTYSCIPPEYKAKNNSSSSRLSTPLLSRQSTTYEPNTPRIPYRDTGPTGKSIFGQAPSWKYKPLPPLPCDQTEHSVSEPLSSKFKEHDCDSANLIDRPGGMSESEMCAKQGRLAKAVKRISEKLTSTV